MSRSGYSDGDESDGIALWRGQVANATRGKRGQAFFIDLVKGLDEMPEKRLLDRVIQCEDGMCALGVVGARRGIDLTKYNPRNNDSYEDAELTEEVGAELNIASQLAREVTFMNDEGTWNPETPEERWTRIRAWAFAQILPVFDTPTNTDAKP